MRTSAISILMLAFSLTQTGFKAQAAAEDPPPTKEKSNIVDPAASKETLAQAIAKMPRWTVLIEASAYRVGASGKVRMPGSTALSSTLGQSSVTLEEIGADSPRWAPYGRLRWRPAQGNWSFMASGFGTKLDVDGVVKQNQRVGDMIQRPGDFIHTEIQFYNIDIEAGYRFFERARGIQKSSGATKLSPYVDLTAGLRVIDTDVRFRHTSNLATPVILPGQRFEAENHDLFIHPIVGIRGGIELVEQFNVELRTNVGGLPGTRRSITWDIEPCFTWRPHANFGVHVGYRSLFMSVRSGGDNERFSWRGSMAGLYFGVTGRF